MGNCFTGDDHEKQDGDAATDVLILPSSSNPPGNVPLPTLPIELVVEILCRLRVKSLLQFRCVCKSWDSIISDPKFAKKQLGCSDLTRHRLIVRHNNTPSSTSVVFTVSQLLSVFNNVVPFIQLDHPLKNYRSIDFIVGSCDGMVCMDMQESNGLIWNPSTRVFKELPLLEDPPCRGRYTTYGFGYDHFSDSYKVVAVCYSDPKTPHIKVHTLGTDSWRTIEEGLGFPCRFWYGEGGIFVGGALNWLLFNKYTRDWSIVSLDLGKESHQQHLLPPDCSRSCLCLGLLKNCLSLVSQFEEYACVWLMKEYGNKDSWTKLFRINLDRSTCLLKKTLHISDDQVLLETRIRDPYYLSFKSVLDVYDQIYNTHKFQHNTTMYTSHMVYVESLISPRC